MYDLLVNLAASVIAGSVGWFAQFLIRYRRRALMRSFLGLGGDAGCLLVAPRHASSHRPHSVHRRDVAALVELATLAKECGATTSVVGAEEATEFGRVTEFCVGGPDANARTAAHLLNTLPAVRFEPYTASANNLAFWIGLRAFPCELGVREYALLAKIRGPAAPRPVFLIAGQRASGNLAVARYLSQHHREFRRRYGATGQFCIVVEIVQPDAYGSDFVRQAADVTEQAFATDQSLPSSRSI